LSLLLDYCCRLFRRYACYAAAIVAACYAAIPSSPLLIDVATLLRQDYCCRYAISAMLLFFLLRCYIFAFFRRYDFRLMLFCCQDATLAAELTR